MPFHVKIRKKNPAGKPGKCFGTFGPFANQALAKKQAQVFADDAAPGMVVTVEPVRSNPRRNASGYDAATNLLRHATGGTTARFVSHRAAPAKSTVAAGWVKASGYVVCGRYLIYPDAAAHALFGGRGRAPSTWTQIGPFKNKADATKAAKSAYAARAFKSEIKARNAAIEAFAPRSNPRKRRNPRRRRNTVSVPAPNIVGGALNPRRSNGRTTTRTHRGHAIKGKRGNYVVVAYDKAFTTVKAAKAWVDRHVAAELRRLNPRRR